MSLTASVVIITYARPAYVKEALTHLRDLRTQPAQTIVVDASPDDRTVALLADEFPEVMLVRNELGRGTMPESRQLGLLAATSDVVAFIDDDAYVDPGWLDEILAPYKDREVVAVGGRAINGIPGEETEGLDQIGCFLPSGELTGNFAADPGRVVEVDHMLGANMSYRRASLIAIGGIRGDYPGTCLREETDTALRLRGPGQRIVFNPRAIVRHVAAPYEIGGQRFDRRYLYYSRRNHVVLLLRNFGWRDPVTYRYLRTALGSQGSYVRTAWRRLGPTKSDGSRRALRKRVTGPPIVLTRAIVEVGGLVAGFSAAAIARRRDRRAGVPTP